MTTAEIWIVVAVVVISPIIAAFCIWVGKKLQP